MILSVPSGRVSASDAMSVVPACPLGVPCGSTECAQGASEAVEPSGGEKPRPQPHWSHLPIWGVDAEARGHQIPLPFGIGVNYYREQQPFKIKDLQVGIVGRPPESVTNFVQIDQVDTTQQAVTARFDVWVFPFVSVYGIAGYTSGRMTGAVDLPAVPILDIPAQRLPISLSYEGPTYGGGVTLAGGFKVSEWHNLTAFMVADTNYTITPLSFKHETLFTDTKMTTLVFSSRVGLRGAVTSSTHAALWAGAMYEGISETVAGQSSTSSLEFLVKQSPVAPWNAVIGGRFEAGRHVDILVEGGIGTRSSFLAAITFRF